jgi:glycosyltransferase involved in cell wall biosynthesis
MSLTIQKINKASLNKFLPPTKPINSMRQPVPVNLLALNKVTALILTYDEVPNISRTLDRLSWANRVVVVDSYSTDGTIELLERYPNVEVFYRKFDGFAQQCNYGLELINTEWVLSMDADYVLSEPIIAEMNGIVRDGAAEGAWAAFRYCVAGKPLNKDNTTPRKVLYRRQHAHYENLGHQHRVNVPGTEVIMQHKIYHDDRKSLSRWLRSQDGYLTIEAEKINQSKYGDLDFADKIRKTKVLGPIVILFYCLFAQGLLFKGWRGWYYTLQRTLVEILLVIKLIGSIEFDLEDYTSLPDE